jgi:hypothetical protein
VATATRSNTQDGGENDYQGHLDDPQALVDGLGHVSGKGLSVVGVFDRLRDVAPSDTEREYLEQIYVHPAGFAFATDAHILAVVKVDTAGIEEPFSMPVPDVHKTDDITPGVGSVTVECDHQTDYSGEYQAPGEDIPDASMVVPNLDDLETPAESVKFNPSKMAELGQAIGDSKHGGLGVMNTFSTDSPIYCEGKYGFGVVMPMRPDGNMSIV